MPVACPTTTMMVAMSYIQRLKRKYSTVKGARGCSQRLLLVAYMISAKYIHACLRTIVDYSQHLEEVKQISAAEEPVKPTVQASSPPMPTAQSLGSAKQPDSPPASPPMSSTKSQPTAAQLYRMELEFLHFLDYDLLVPNPCALIDWWYRCVRDLDCTGE